jgi:hypothetical protein
VTEMQAFLEGPGHRAPAVRAALPQGGKSAHRTDPEHPALPRRAPRPRASRCRGKALDAPAAAHARGFHRRDPRPPPSAGADALLRGPETGVQKAGLRIPRGPLAEISRLLRARAGAQSRRTRLARGRQAHVCRPVACPGGRRPRVRLPALHPRALATGRESRRCVREPLRARASGVTSPRNGGSPSTTTTSSAATPSFPSDRVRRHRPRRILRPHRLRRGSAAHAGDAAAAARAASRGDPLREISRRSSARTFRSTTQRCSASSSPKGAAAGASSTTCSSQVSFGRSASGSPRSPRACAGMRPPTTCARAATCCSRCTCPTVTTSRMSASADRCRPRRCGSRRASNRKRLTISIVSPSHAAGNTFSSRGSGPNGCRSIRSTWPSSTCPTTR